VFDNRGVLNKTLGTKDYTINQLADDAKGLLDVLNITKADILGYSMGGMIAQELTLQHKDKVDDLIIYASYCGTKNQTYLPPEKLLLQFGDLNGTEDEIKKRFVPYQFPKDWIEQNTEKYDKISSSFKLPSKETLQKQQKAIFDWINNGGSCDRLKDIQQDTLIIAGTADKVIPSINSEILKDKIERAQLETFVGGGHALMFQFPERLSEVINTFLDK
jgi:pimeloyl-ACP methyl ester carboxylesterase